MHLELCELCCLSCQLCLDGPVHICLTCWLCAAHREMIRVRYMHQSAVGEVQQVGLMLRHQVMTACDVTCWAEQHQQRPAGCHFLRAEQYWSLPKMVLYVCYAEEGHMQSCCLEASAGTEHPKLRTPPANMLHSMSARVHPIFAYVSWLGKRQAMPEQGVITKAIDSECLHCMMQ